MTPWGLRTTTSQFPVPFESICIMSICTSYSSEASDSHSQVRSRHVLLSSGLQRYNARKARNAVHLQFIPKQQLHCSNKDLKWDTCLFGKLCWSQPHVCMQAGEKKLSQVIFMQSGKGTATLADPALPGGHTHYSARLCSVLRERILGGVGLLCTNATAACLYRMQCSEQLTWNAPAE